MEFLQSYWLWILVAIGVGWFLMRRGHVPAHRAASEHTLNIP